jgi:pSer/pThr/pTyr-binding forkhead associated (FHA) protein
MTRETPVERFRKACGFEAPLALTCQDADSPGAEPAAIEWPAPFLLIGRHPREDLFLDSPQVSRRHAFILAVAGRIIGVDLKSRTQILWDEEAVARDWDWLDPGRFLQIGPYRIRRSDPRPDEPPPPLDPFSDPADQGSPSAWLPRPVFELPFRMGGVASTWEMPGLLALVGRTDDCQFILTDDSISRSHACLVRTPVGTWVVDIGIREGVHVNGTRVRWAWLADGDLVRFGLFTLIVRYDRSPEGLSREDVPLEAGAHTAGSHEKHRSFAGLPAKVGRTGLALRRGVRPPAVAELSGLPADFSQGAPAAVSRGEWEPAYGPGPSPYAMWYQQMQLMETFHNDMAMMVQMFIAMHREFQGSVRAELDRVQQLTRELGRLNARLSRLEKPGETGQTAAAVRPEGKVRPVSEKPRPESRLASPRQTAPRQKSTTARQDAAREATGRPEPPAGAVPGSRSRKESPELYADLTQRITELQQERRTYWQRILKTING